MKRESAVFRAVADETRREILRLLSSARRPVAELATCFPAISRPAVSKHLRILREAGLVTESREGRRRLYRLCPQALAVIGRWLTEVETRRAHDPADRVDPVDRAKTVVRTRGTRGARKAGLASSPRRAGRLRPLRRDESDEADWRAW